MIPTQIGSLTELVQLYLDYNSFSSNKLHMYGYDSVYMLTTVDTIPTSIMNMVSLKELYLSYNKLTGTVPFGLCYISGLINLHISDGGGNSGISCAPYCLSSVTTRVIPTTCAVSVQDTGLCGLIAATNIQSVRTQWSCTTAGYTSSDPCSTLWSSVTCVGSVVVSIDVGSSGLTGLIMMYEIPLNKYV